MWQPQSERTWRCFLGIDEEAFSGGRTAEGEARLALQVSADGRKESGGNVWQPGGRTDVRRWVCSDRGHHQNSPPPLVGHCRALRLTCRDWFWRAHQRTVHHHTGEGCTHWAWMRSEGRRRREGLKGICEWTKWECCSASCHRHKGEKGKGRRGEERRGGGEDKAQ